MNKEKPNLNEQRVIRKQKIKISIDVNRECSALVHIQKLWPLFSIVFFFIFFIVPLYHVSKCLTFNVIYMLFIYRNRYSSSYKQNVLRWSQEVHWWSHIYYLYEAIVFYNCVQDTILHQTDRIAQINSSFFFFFDTFTILCAKPARLLFAHHKEHSHTNIYFTLIALKMITFIHVIHFCSKSFELYFFFGFYWNSTSFEIGFITFSCRRNSLWSEFHLI